MLLKTYRSEALPLDVVHRLTQDWCVPEKNPKRNNYLEGELHWQLLESFWDRSRIYMTDHVFSLSRKDRSRVYVVEKGQI